MLTELLDLVPWIGAVLVWILAIIVVAIVIEIAQFAVLQVRRWRSKRELVEFERMMQHVAGGKFIGTPLSPNEQVLRAVCYCDCSDRGDVAQRRLLRADPFIPIRFAQVDAGATAVEESRLTTTTTNTTINTISTNCPSTSEMFF